MNKMMPMEEVRRQLGISDSTYCNWRKEYGKLRIDQAKRLNLIAEFTIDNAVLKGAGRGNR
jgi:putative transposase